MSHPTPQDAAHPQVSNKSQENFAKVFTTLEHISSALTELKRDMARLPELQSAIDVLKASQLTVGESTTQLRVRVEDVEHKIDGVKDSINNGLTSVREAQRTSEQEIYTVMSQKMQPINTKIYIAWGGGIVIIALLGYASNLLTDGIKSYMAMREKSIELTTEQRILNETFRNEIKELRASLATSDANRRSDENENRR